MKLETFKCNGCGKVKGEANKWYRAGVIAKAFTIEAFDVWPAGSVFDHPRDQPMDLCGEACVLKKLQEFLATAHSEATR